jgi:hypothetical protein
MSKLLGDDDDAAAATELSGDTMEEECAKAVVAAVVGSGLPPPTDAGENNRPSSSSRSQSRRILTGVTSPSAVSSLVSFDFVAGRSSVDNELNCRSRLVGAIGMVKYGLDVICLLMAEFRCLQLLYAVSCCSLMWSDRFVRDVGVPELLGGLGANVLGVQCFVCRGKTRGRENQRLCYRTKSNDFEFKCCLPGCHFLRW